MKNCIFTLLLLTAGLVAADEGEWPPWQLSEVQPELSRLGFELTAAQLADLSRPPLNAVISLGGCTASFVSPTGLIVTNHHCAFAAIQRNSTAAENYIAKGFIATKLTDELPAGPSQRVYVTESIVDVTSQVTNGIGDDVGGKDRYRRIEERTKRLVATCEADKAYRCTVAAYHRGSDFRLIKRLMIRDVRLVYAPPESIGDYGGDVDNFEWPRHTGDFAFLRAWVGPDGRPADPSPANVPYHPPGFLELAPAGVAAGDPVLVAGYPGRTFRWKLASELRFSRDFEYPAGIAESQRELAAIQAATQANADWPVRYASVVSGIENRLKRLEGFLAGFRRKDLAAAKDVEREQLTAWLEAAPADAARQGLFEELDRLIERDQALDREDRYYDIAKTSELLRTATTLYRLAKEGGKPDPERESGYQERDVPFIRARFERLEQSLVAEVDAARWRSALDRYTQLAPADRSAVFDAAVGLDKTTVADLVATTYRATSLADTQSRIGLIGKKPAELEAMQDSFIQLAVKLYPHEIALEDRGKEIAGEFDRLIPRYMANVTAWKRSQGQLVYPDANGTLRVSYGTVVSYIPRDGVTYTPFTTVEGIVEKATGVAPFAAPAGLLAAIKAKRYNAFAAPALGTVPVDVLSSVDTTGGNSGSPILDRHGRLVGLIFDSTRESIAKDWVFDPSQTRAIHVDIRYVLWVLAEVDRASSLLTELRIQPAPSP